MLLDMTSILKTRHFYFAVHSPALLVIHSFVPIIVTLEQYGWVSFTSLKWWIVGRIESPICKFFHVLLHSGKVVSLLPF